MRNKKLLFVACFLLFGIFGLITLATSRGANVATSFTPSDGAITGCASTISDASASTGQAVAFGGCTDSSGLDASGKTISDTNYAIPTGAIFMSPNGSDTNDGTKNAPVKTLNKAISTVSLGGTIVARGGTYHDWYHSGGVQKIVIKGFTLQAYPHEQVWFDGTDVIPTGNWKSDGAGHWYMSWSTPQFCDGAYYDFPYNNQSKGPSNLTGTSGKTYASNRGPCTHWDNYGPTSAEYSAAGDPQMVFIDGARTAQVDSLAAATGGKFYYDWARRTIYISTNPSGRTVELAARPTALILGNSAKGYNIKGIGFKRYASNEYENLTASAVYIGGTAESHVENSVFTQNAGKGLSMNTSKSSMSRNVFVYNGFNGAHFYGHATTTKVTDNFVMQDNIVSNNNLENYGLNCSISCAAAGIKMSGVLGYTIKNNVFENNRGKAAGAWCDYNCYDGAFVNNLVKNNHTGYDYEQNNRAIIAGNLIIGGTYGINVSADGAKIYNNTIIDVKTIPMRVYDDNRIITTNNISLGNNVIAGTAVNTSWLNGRYGTAVQSDPAGWFTYYDYNSYWRPTNFTLYRLINASDQYYSSSAKFNQAYPNFEDHATDYVGSTDPFFVNSAGGDYRVRSGSPAYKSGGALPADVAQAMGASTAAGQNRGAFSYPTSK